MSRWWIATISIRWSIFASLGNKSQAKWLSLIGFWMFPTKEKWEGSEGQNLILADSEVFSVYYDREDVCQTTKVRIFLKALSSMIKNDGYFCLVFCFALLVAVGGGGVTLREEIVCERNMCGINFCGLEVQNGLNLRNKFLWMTL